MRGDAGLPDIFLTGTRTRFYLVEGPRTTGCRIPACAGMTGVISARRMTKRRNGGRRAKVGQLRVFAIAAFALGFAPAVLAQSEPSNLLKRVIPFAPGHQRDILPHLNGP